MRVTHICLPEADGRCRVFWLLDGVWVHKGWLMEELK